MLVAPVEVAQEVAAVDAVELQQARGLGHRAQRVAQPLAAVEAARRQPRVALDDVAGDQRVLEVEGGDVALGVEHLAAQPLGAVGARLARLGLDPGVLDDRGQVDRADVGRPVDLRRIEGERRPVGVVEPLPHRHQVVDLVHGLALGVQAVQLDVLERPLDLHPLGLQLGRQLGLLAAQGERLEHLLAAADHRLGPGELALHPPAAREPELGHDDRLALAVVDRVLGEPAADVVDERPVLQRVDPAGGDLADRRCLVRAEGGDGDDRGDDEVDGDDVDDALRHAGELAQQAPGVGDEHRLGHPEAADPARPRLGPRRLDDRRAHDADRHVALAVGERLLAEGLGEGVGVGPTDAGGTGPAGLDEAVADPALAQLLGLGGERRRAGRAQLGAGGGAELDELRRIAAGRLGVAAQAAGRGDLAPSSSGRGRTARR